MARNKILVVEDDPDVRQAMHIRLRSSDYDTCLASDALSCMVQARKNTPDLILLDLGLPAGDGFLVMERLKRIPSLAVIPIIIVSARNVHENQDRALRAGAAAYLQKPVENAELLAVIRKTLGYAALPEISEPDRLAAI